jgi:hypothetical protein
VATTASDLICAGVSATFRRTSALPVVPAAHPDSGTQHESLTTTDREQGAR